MINVRATTFCERGTDIDPPRIVTVAAATATVVLPPEPLAGEIASRYIQNVGANALYYSFGVYEDVAGSDEVLPVCDNVNQYHGYLAAGQQLDCSSHRKIVCVYSVAGTTVATTTVRRKDLTRHN